MKKKYKEWIIHVIFTVVGAAFGAGLCYLIGYLTGTKIIASDIVSPMIYMGIAGMLISGIVVNEKNDKCNI